MFKLFHTPIKTPLKTRILVLAAVLSCAVAGAASAADVKPRLIRFGYGLNEESVQGRAAPPGAGTGEDQRRQAEDEDLRLGQPGLGRTDAGRAGRRK